MKTFNIESETVVADEYKFAGNQHARAIAVNAIRVFRFRYLDGDVTSLPKYILKSIRAAGYTAHYLGGTTYSHSVIGLAFTTINDERSALNRAWWGIQNMKYLMERSEMAFALFPELKSEFVPRLVALRLEVTNA
ncbi:MAG: hypothetical protein WC236_15925 [Gallionellaceae bacterium]|jgi:hypothetical protein